MRPDNRLLLARCSRVSIAIVIPQLPCRDGPGVRDDGSDSAQWLRETAVLVLLPYGSHVSEHVCTNEVPHVSTLGSHLQLGTSGCLCRWDVCISSGLGFGDSDIQFLQVLAVFLQMPMQP